MGRIPVLRVSVYFYVSESCVRLKGNILSGEFNEHLDCQIAAIFTIMQVKYTHNIQCK